MKTRTYMDVRFDVTNLDDDERGRLALHVAVQREGGSDEGYPDVPEPEIEWNDVEVREDAPTSPLDPESEEYLALVESAWWNLMHGDLALYVPQEPDAADSTSRDLVIRLTKAGRENIEMIGDAVDQFDGKGNVLPEVTDVEMARRVANALSIVYYGGGS